VQDRHWYKSYVSGVPRTIDYERITVSEALTRTVSRFPNRVAFNYMGTDITYSQFEKLVNQFARALMDIGVSPGDKVAVCLPNIPQTFIANYAIFRIGAVAVQNNPLYTERELAYQLNDSDATVVITLTLLLPRIEKIMAETKLKKIIACHIHSYLPFPKKQLFPYVKKAMYRKVTADDTVLVFKDIIKKYSGESMEEKSSWKELAVLIYTGGTTGVSKGVMLSHENISINAQQFSSWFPDLKDGEERLLGTLPAFHSAGFTLSNFYIQRGFAHLIIPRPEIKPLVKMIIKDKPTFLTGVPTIYVGLLNDPEFRNLDFSNVKGFFSGAAPLAADTIRDIKELIGANMGEVYGLTETSPMVTVTPWGGEVKPGTVGVPLPDTDVRIVDMDSAKKEMPVGEEGEIAIKGPQVMMGYYNKPEETEKVLKDGWFYTGDVGKFDEDGYLSIVDRKKDLIIAGGYNIYPMEIDDILFDHPKILEACAVGVPDSYRGETVKVFIVLKDGETMTEQEVIAYCKERMAAYKVPKMVAFIDELPKSAVGKILRRTLKEMEEQKNS